MFCQICLTKHIISLFKCITYNLQDGVMIPFFDDPGTKHSLKTVGKKLVFSINDLLPEDAGLYQVDVEDVNLFSTDFKSKDIFSDIASIKNITFQMSLVAADPIHLNVTSFNTSLNNNVFLESSSTDFFWSCNCRFIDS